ncbi:radical SAM/Cys-rich domain-containing protein [Thiohalospira halophila DSM 15071]|uniref:Radical SAM/Cys-rich domain-containing protein n=1 Tax=Thiohalospira halophila DSM 15071 TaxID=1123397 RepID=A0A1I1U5N1_9GAMM|nr:arsenosugar biosynthesis radical SAM (seleno)protein ArsS [Thiohalospira halophila]SFD66136.1 radical SAM/Cys-rich domain-containing protein [Thiohalospira halophila DSM 15071]
MHATLHRLQRSDFPAIRRGALETLQVNLGYQCNQACLHCHVNAGPKRTEMMSAETVDTVIAFLEASGVRELDLTGGAPELHPEFRRLVVAARERGVHVRDRCNLTILLEPGHEDLADFLADHDVEVVASLPCYEAENVDAQRGEGVHDGSIRALRLLNQRGYGSGDGRHRLDLVYNPGGPHLPPEQGALEAAYREELQGRFGIVFDHLLALANLPIQRFGSTLVSRGQFDDYMALLRGSHRDENLAAVMCRSLISVDWQGQVYDCDFNQMLGLHLGGGGPVHLADLLQRDLAGEPIAVADHCYGCTAGQGSSCGGALAAG